MKLARPAPLSKVVRTICLPDPEEDLATGHCVTSGWGRYGPTQSLSTALLEASVPLLDLEKCTKAYGKSVPIRNSHLCAGHTDGSSGSCVVSTEFLFHCIQKMNFGIKMAHLVRRQIFISQVYYSKIA